MLSDKCPISVRPFVLDHVSTTYVRVSCLVCRKKVTHQKPLSSQVSFLDYDFLLSRYREVRCFKKVGVSSRATISVEIANSVCVSHLDQTDTVSVVDNLHVSYMYLLLSLPLSTLGATHKHVSWE